MAPYGRLLNSNEADQGRRGSSGLLGPRTEQFALGSLYYLINYGFEVYGDRCLTEDPREHGPKVVALLQNMEFPELGGDPRIDDIIERCWRNKYTTVAELAAHTEALLTEGTHREGISIETVFIAQLYMAIGRAISGLWCSVADWVRQSANTQTTNTDVADGDSSEDVDQNHPEEDFSSKTAFCQDLEERGLLRLLCSDEPEQLGFTFEWYRHSC